MAKKTLQIKQTGSPIGRKEDQQATLRGLGLNRIGRERTLEDSPCIRGMLFKVRHLVLVNGERITSKDF